MKNMKGHEGQILALSFGHFDRHLSLTSSPGNFTLGAYASF